MEYLVEPFRVNDIFSLDEARKRLLEGSLERYLMHRISTFDYHNIIGEDIKEKIETIKNKIKYDDQPYYKHTISFNAGYVGGLTSYFDGSWKPQQTGSKNKIFHTFKYKLREITLVAINNSYGKVDIGYSVCMNEDRYSEKYDKKLSHKIALGRADSERRLGQEEVSQHLAENRGVLKGIAYYWESQILKGEVVIKGIR